MDKVELYKKYKLGLIKLEDLDIIDLLSILEYMEYEIDHVIKEIKVKESVLIDLKPDDD